MGQIGQKEFRDDSVADEPDLTFLFLLGWGWMGGHNDTNERSALVQALVWAVVEGAADPAFCTAQVLSSRQVQASLNIDAIEHPVVFATRNIRAVGQIGDDRSCPILAIKAQQRSLCGKAVGLHVGLDGGLRPAQFFSILSIARIAKAGHPLMGMHLQDRGARANNFSSFASRVAGATERTQTPLGSWPIWRPR